MASSGPREKKGDTEQAGSVILWQSETHSPACLTVLYEEAKTEPLLFLHRGVPRQEAGKAGRGDEKTLKMWFWKTVAWKCDPTQLSSHRR